MCGITALVGNQTRADAFRTETLHHRGPDSCKRISTPQVTLLFNRLAIMDTSDTGNQPFHKDGVYVMCNGEIYNWRELVHQYHLSHDYVSKSDCEVILHLYLRYRPADETTKLHNLFDSLRGVFALVIYDTRFNTVVVARDSIGVRPLFCAFEDNSSCVAFASEAKALLALGFRDNIEQFPAAHYATLRIDSNNAVFSASVRPYWEIPPLYVPKLLADVLPVTLYAVETALREAVHVRMQSDRQIGCLLSGGLDSSLVAGIMAAELRSSGQQLHTFSIGMPGSTDLHYARVVADHIHSIHHEVCLSEQEFLDAIPDVIRTIESYDITTVRASTGMYLLSKWIATNTDVRVIFSGEGSDELCQGYLYFHLQPTAVAGDTESRRLLRDLPFFDVLRADRTTAAWGLELREPFLDRALITFYLSLARQWRRPRQGIEKWLLRKAFEKSGLLPPEVLWRTKEAFSDGVSSTARSWHTVIGQFVQSQVTSGTLVLPDLPGAPTNVSVESRWYYHLFCQHYAGLDHLVPYYWRPKWVSESDPSARQLQVYAQKAKQ